MHEVDQPKERKWPLPASYRFFPSWYYCMLLLSDPVTSKAHTVTSCTKV